MRKSVNWAGVDEPIVYDIAEEIDGDGDPDVSFDGGLAGALEGLDAKLLNLFEKQIDVPAAPADMELRPRGEKPIVTGLDFIIL